MGIEKAYNLWAKQYDTNKNKTRDLDKIVTIKTLSKYDFDHVLELGCGTGKNTVWLAQKATKIIGLDFSQEMLNKAKSKFSTTMVSFQKADLTQNWAIDDDFADLITCSLTLEHIENLNPIFAQANQKAKENGLFFICELHPFKQYLGSQARFESTEGIQKLTVFTHHIYEYIDTALKNGFELVKLKEWFDKDGEQEIPRLVSFVFRKT